MTKLLRNGGVILTKDELMFKKIQIVAQIIVEASIKEYSSIFKAGVVLLGVCLIGASQIFPKVIELDFATRKIQFEVEEKEKISVTKSACDKLTKNKAECRLALYRLNNNATSMHLVSGFVVYSGFIGMFLVFLSSVGFVNERWHSERRITKSSSKDSASGAA